MAVSSQALSYKKQHLAGMSRVPGLRPARQAAAVGNVQIVDAPSLTAPPQPTNADVLKAIQDLGSKIHQLSKNQQTLETKLDHLKKTVDAIDSNVITGANWLFQWIIWLDWDVTVTQDTGIEGTIPQQVHWK